MAKRVANHQILRVHMAGAEWFSARAGGLNRYFESLFFALAQRPDVYVTAQAFGTPSHGCDERARSWGPTGENIVKRVQASRQPVTLPAGAVLDRHFCLYGPPSKQATLVAHFHGPWSAESQMAGDNRIQQWTKFRIEKSMYSRVERFIVLGAAFKDLLSSTYGIEGHRITVIPPGVDLARFPMSQFSGDDEPLALCVRRLERRMGIDVLLRAWREISDAARGIRLVIVGTGSEDRALKEYAHQLGVQESVVFTGRVSDQQLSEYYARSLFTVVPTIALEGFGLIALESLASGRAPIVTNCGGLPDSVRGLDPSLIVPAGDPEALAARIEEALGGNLPAPELCRSHAETFSWSSVAQKHVDLYRELK